jgi:hypothetical protein
MWHGAPEPWVEYFLSNWRVILIVECVLSGILIWCSPLNPSNVVEPSRLRALSTRIRMVRLPPLSQPPRTYLPIRNLSTWWLINSWWTPEVFFTPSSCIPPQLDLSHCPPAPLLPPLPQSRLDLHSLHHRSPPSSTAPEWMCVKTLVTRRMKGSPVRSTKTGTLKKRCRDKADDAGQSSSSPPPSTLPIWRRSGRRLRWRLKTSSP